MEKRNDDDTTDGTSEVLGARATNGAAPAGAPDAGATILRRMVRLPSLHADDAV